MSCRVLLTTVLLGGLICACLPAAPISGTFNIAGTITVTTTTITWTLNDPPFPADKATIGPGDTGDFASLGGTTVTIHDLNNAIEPVGVTFPSQPFISFDAGPSLPTLNVNFIFGGIYNATQCGTLPAAVGQTCTLPGSPFNFVNNPPGPPQGPQATASFVFMGVTSDGLENWQGNFTSQFTVPYQTVLASLAANGSVSNTYSATFTLSPVSVIPETGTLGMLGLGLVALSWKLRQRRTT
jgi:hypothetical protein